jgi:beta-galactosidase
MFRFGTEQYWHGVLYHHGQPGRRHDELKAIGSELKRAGEQFLGSKNRNQVAMILSYDALGKFGVELRSAFVKHEAAYYEGLQTHFEKHLSLLKD